MDQLQKEDNWKCEKHGVGGRSRDLLGVWYPVEVYLVLGEEEPYIILIKKPHTCILFFQLAYKKLRIFSDIHALSLIFHVVYMAQHFAKPNYFVLEKRQPNMFNENMPNILYKINCNNTIQCNCITICLKQYNTNISLNA